MTLAKYNTKKGSPNERRKRKLEELLIKNSEYRENYSTKSNEEHDAEEDEDSE